MSKRRHSSRDVSPRAVATAIGGTALIILVAWGSLSSFFTVEADEVGVITRFGKFTGTLAQPGLHFKLPFGVDQVENVKVDRVYKLEFGYRTVGTPRRGPSVYRQDASQQLLMLTGDQNVVSVEWIVQYKIKDPVKWLFQIKDPIESIRDISEAAMRLIVGDSSATEALTSRRQQIAFEVQEKLQEILDRYDSGVEVVTVELQNVIPPTAAVQDSFNEVNRARQEKETTINQAQRDLQRAIPEAEGEANQLVEEAEGYKLKRINEALGDVAKFRSLLKEYQAAKEITRSRLYLEAIEEVLPQLTQIYVLDEGQENPLKVLDLKGTQGAGARSRQRSRSSAADSKSSTSR